MSTAPIAMSLRRMVRRAACDGELLDAFCQQRDQAAFEELVRRYAPLVAGVCRRMLGQAEDAEDAMQATFLILARKASAVTRAERLAGWLHTVALRAATEIRSMRQRYRRSDAVRPVHEAITDSLPDSALAAVLDEELARLPDHYRLPIIRCELQGQSRAEAAAALKIPEGTLSSRLAEAKKRLAKRLKQRGITAGTAALLAAARGDGTAAGAVELARAALGGASPLALAAADVVVKSMVVAKLSGLAIATFVLMLAGGVLCVGAGSHGGQARAESTDRDPKALVAQLGSAKYADREEAQRQLLAMGSAARAAVQAGLNDPNPEVARRCAALLPLMSIEELKRPGHPAWDRFRRIVGDGDGSRRLFLEIIGDSRRAALIEAAEARPDAAGEVYRRELVARIGAFRAGFEEAERRAGAFSGELVLTSGKPTRGDCATLLFLGTYPAASDVAFRPADDKDRFAHRTFIARGLADSRGEKRGAIPVEVRRLFAAWLTARTNPEPRRIGMELALRYGLQEALPAARAAARADTTPQVQGYGLLIIGQFGTLADLPLLRAAFDDARSFMKLLPKGPGLPVIDAQVGDLALAAALRLSGQHPAAFGFPYLDAKDRLDLVLLRDYRLGFADATTRAAAHTKAREWLTTGKQ